MSKILDFVVYFLVVMIPTTAFGYVVSHALIQDGFSNAAVGGLSGLALGSLSGTLYKIYKIPSK